MLKYQILLTACLALSAIGAEKLFPEAGQVDPSIRYEKNSKVEVAPDGTFRVNGKIHHFLSAEIEPAHPYARKNLKIPGVPESLGWLYNTYPDYDYLQRVGFDSIGAKAPPYFLKEYSKTVKINAMADSPAVAAEQKQVWQSGLPVYVDITCFEYQEGSLAFGFMGCKKSDIPEEARNTRYNTPWNRWAPYSFMHPAGREIYRKMWTNAADFARKQGTRVLAYELFNEAGYNDPSEYNRNLFIGYLKRRYKTPEAMNRLWRSNYASFEDASRFKDQRENLGLFADWGKFMEECVVDLCAFGLREIKKIDPDARVTNQINGAAMYRRVSLNNFNMYHISNVLNAVAYPTGGANVQLNGLSKEPEQTLYAADFADLERLPIYAYYKVLSEGKPLLNDENYEHGNIFNAAWQDVIHQSGATNFWSWDTGYHRLKPHERTIKGLQDSALKFPWELINPFAFAPEELTQFATAQKEIAKFKEIFLPRDRGVKSEVAVLLSYPTSRRAGFDLNIPNSELMPLYANSLIFTHYPIDIIAEEHLAEGRADRYKAIVAAGVRNVMTGTLNRLMDFVGKGGVLILGREFLQYDEYDNPNPDWNAYPDLRIVQKENGFSGYTKFDTDFRTSVLPGELKGLSSLSATFSGKWEEIGKCGDRGALFRKQYGKGWIYAVLPELRMYPLGTVLRGILERHNIHPALGIANAGGVELPPNVELHVSRCGGKYAAFLFNHDAYPKVLTLKPEPAAGAFDLIDRKELPKTGHGFLYYLPPHQRGIVAFGKAEEYKEFGPFSAISEKDIFTAKEKEDALLEEKRKAIKTLYTPDLLRTRAIDLRSFCNRNYTDDKAGDGQGGWSDEGAKMSLNYVPLQQEILEGVPCDFIRADMNEYRTCIVLKSTRSGNTELPEAVANIPVNAQVKNLFFFHTAVWAEKDKQVLTYRIRYVNGKTLDIPIRTGREIGDWYLAVAPLPLQKQIAWRNSEGYGFFIWDWRNPHPQDEIRSVDILSGNGPTVPIVLGITVEEPEHKSMMPINSEEDFDACFVLEPHYQKVFKEKIFLQSTDSQGLLLYNMDSNSSFISRKNLAAGSVSLELKNGTTPRMSMDILADKGNCFQLMLDFKQKKGSLVRMADRKETEKQEFEIPASPPENVYWLTGSYKNGKVTFQFNGALLAELPAPPGLQGKIILRHYWWSKIYVRKISITQ